MGRREVESAGPGAVAVASQEQAGPAVASPRQGEVVAIRLEVVAAVVQVWTPWGCSVHVVAAVAGYTETASGAAVAQVLQLAGHLGDIAAGSSVPGTEAVPVVSGVAAEAF